MSKTKRKKAGPSKPTRPKLQVFTPPSNNHPSKICLSIIVKNESQVIERMLKSVTPILDFYCVIDTGSTDGTQEIIKKFFEEAGIPGKVIDHPWVNFEDARNKAVQETKTIFEENGVEKGFGFWIDADEQLLIDSRFNRTTFLKNISSFDGVNIRVTYGNQKYFRMQMFSSDKPWRWYGPLHEVLVCDEPTRVGEAEGLGVLVTPDGNSWTSESQPEKYSKHAQLLLDYVNNDPKKDPRWIFYLAQSYRDANTPESRVESLKWYQKRVTTTGGFWEEIYFSQMMVASLKAQLNYPDSEVMEEYRKCGKYNIHRIEHLAPLILYYQSIKEFDIAYMYSSYAMKHTGKTPLPKSALFIDEGLYLWQMYDLHSINCWWSGRREESKDVFRKLWRIVKIGGIVPNHEIPRLTENSKFYL